MTDPDFVELAGRLGRYAASQLPKRTDVGYIVITARNCPGGGSDQATATNISETHIIVELLRELANQIERGDCERETYKVERPS